MFFDPFRRHERISFVVDQNPLTVIETTVGQLNFFRWATENEVINYVFTKLADIELHMAKYQKEHKSRCDPSVKSHSKSSPNSLVHGLCHVVFN